MIGGTPARLSARLVEACAGSLVWLALSCGGSPSAPSPPNAPENEFDRRILAHLQSMEVPGLSVAVVQGESITTKVYGWSDVERRIAMTPETVFQAGSISKTFTGVVIMRAVEEGRLNLDEDVNRHLPFRVRNPAAPSSPITLRHLMTHTSSIRDDAGTLGDVNRSPIPVGSFLENYLTPGRKYFSRSFFSYGPGGGLAYANTGGALAGYVLESATGRAFESITQEAIFGPLGMDHAAWAPAPIAGVQNAVPYINYKPVVPDEYPMLTPSGSLRTTTLDLSRFLQMFMHGGARQGVHVLSAASVAEMARPQVPQFDSAMGLFWYYQGGYLGHSGGLAGTASYMFFRPGSDLGVIMMMNGHIANNQSRDAEARQMLDEFFANAAQLQANVSPRGLGRPCRDTGCACGRRC